MSLSAGKVREIEKVCKAFANRRRLATVSYLKSRRGGASVGEIAEAIRLSYKSTSHHLRLLVSTGILERDQRGPEASYTLAPTTNKLVAYILGQL